MAIGATESSQVDIGLLGECLVMSEAGERRQLSEFWKAHHVVFVFLRHFACIACRAHVKEVWNRREAYEEADADIVFVGNGQPEFISHFKHDLGVNGARIYTDPSLLTFRVAGFKKSFHKAHSPKSVVNGIKLMNEGHRQKMPSSDAGDVSQLGGVIVVEKGGKLLYHYVSESLGDFPSEQEVQSAIRR